MASPIFQMRLDAETRERWQAAADGSLARFVKEAVEEKIARDSRRDRKLDRVDEMLADGLMPDPIDLPRLTGAPPLGGKAFKGPDPKGGK